MENDNELLASENENISDDVESLQSELKKLRENNRHLFARTKRAEGFEQNEDGKWIKVNIKEKSEPKQPEPKDPKKSDDKLLERLDKMAKKMANIEAGEQEELFNKWKTDTNREADDIISNPIFQKELGELKTAKANLAATSNIKGEHGESGVKNTPDYWIAKATKGPDGKLLFSDETPKELYSKILEKLAENEPGNSEALKFYNSK